MKDSARRRPEDEPEAVAEPAAPRAPLPPASTAGLSMAGIARLRAGASRPVVARIEDMAIAGPEIVKDWHEEADAKIKIKDLGSATDAQKVAEVQRLLTEGGAKALGDADTTGWAISKVWESFGSRMWEVALANRALFESSLARAADLAYYEEGWGGFRLRFKAAVEGRVRDNLAKNAAYVRAEMERLGLSGLPGGGLLRGERDRDLRELQIKAERVAEAQEGMARMRRIPVGFTAEHDEGQDFYFADYFNPDKPPMNPSTVEGHVDKIQDWKEVKAAYDKLGLFLKRAAAESPALFTMIEAGPGSAANFAKGDTDAARAHLQPLMAGLLAKIAEAEGLVGDDLDFREMGPVIEQLLQTPEWSGMLEGKVIRATLWKHNRDKTLRSLGLSALSALGFLFATFASGGATIFIGAAVGVGASATQAGISIEDYYDKAKAREARTGDPELDIMSQEAVDSARTQAILDSVFALLDVWGGAGAVRRIGSPALKLLQAGDAGAKATAEVTLKEGLRATDTTTRTAAIERAVAEIGTEGAARAAGKTPDELARLLPADNETARKLNAAAQAAKVAAPAGEGLLQRLAGLAKLDVDAAARAVSEGFDRIGRIGTLEAAGGWKAVTKKLGEGHPLVTQLEAWRSQIVQEGIDWVKAASKGETTAVRTGTPKGTSDVDISTFGRDAAQNVERVKEFLARRTKTTRDRLDHLLDADVAVNPSRMHIQDIAPGLSDAVHKQILDTSAKHQEHLIFARRWHDAEKVKDVQRMAQLEQAAKDIGIGEINKTWKPMDAKTQAALERELDGWARQLERLEGQAASDAARKPLIEKIGRGQAELLANNPNMYLDMGNIKWLVTRRDIDLEKIETALGFLDPINLKRLGKVWTHERYLMLLGEGPQIDRALEMIRLAQGSPVEIANGLKAFAKHGERVVKTVGADVAHGVQPDVWLHMNEEFGRIMKAVKEGAVPGAGTRELELLLARVKAEARVLDEGMTRAARELRDQSQIGAALTADQAAGLSAWVAAAAASRRQAEALISALQNLHLAMVMGRLVPEEIDEAAALFPFSPADVLWAPELVTPSHQ